MIKNNPHRRNPSFRLEDEFEQRVIDISRVTRVVAGGKRMRFRACVAIGNLKGKIGIGTKKGADVSTAVNKAVTAARKNLIKINLINDTIPHQFRVKFKAASILIKPAPKGTGIKAGGPLRSVLEISGLKNIVAKMLGSENKINNVMAIYIALRSLKKPRTFTNNQPVNMAERKEEKK